MKIKVDGVSITLTKRQVSQIERVKKERLAEMNSFKNALFKSGFKKINMNIHGQYEECYANDEKGWYAEIIDGNRVWMVGAFLQQSYGFPGGWTYDTVEELRTELIRHM